MMPGEHGQFPDPPQPGAKEQVLMTLKVIGMLSAIFGALWVVDIFVKH